METLNEMEKINKKTQQAFAEKAIQDYIKLAFTKDNDPLRSIVSSVYCFLKHDQFESYLMEYHYSIMSFFVAISDPGLSSILREKMCGAHYEIFIDMMERLEDFVRGIDESEKKRALIQLHNIDCLTDLQEEDFKELTKIYTKRVAELRAGMAVK